MKRLVYSVVGMVALIGIGTRAQGGLVPGGGNSAADCYAELDVRGSQNPGTTGNGVQGNKTVTCTDGEACDQGTCGDDRCDLSVALCVNQVDPNVGSCQPPATLDSVKVKSKGSVLLNVNVPQLLQGSQCGAFVDGTLTVTFKKNGKPKIPKTQINIKAKAPKGTKPRTDGDAITIKCLPRTTPCPSTTTTTTTVATTTVTTTTVPSGTFTQLAFLTLTGSTDCGGAGFNPPAAAPFSGQLYSDTGATTPVAGGQLGLGCLYIGGGSAVTVPANKIPDAATTIFAISGPGTLSASAGTGPANCTLGLGATSHCITEVNTGAVCTSDAQCEVASPGSCAPDAQCYFGPPLPIPNGGLSVCVLNAIKTNASGTFDATTGSATISLPLVSRLYLTGNAASPCPTCVSNACVGGANPGDSCTPVGLAATSLQCPPSANTFLAPLDVDLSPLSTDPTSKTSAAGTFCPSQGNAGAFGKPAARAIGETGRAAGDLSDGAAHSSVLGSVFCIPLTGNIAIDISADLPGPGAIGLNGSVQLLP